MIRGIDHLVIAAGDPDRAAAELEAAVGVAVTGGGRHEGAGTFNRIAWLADGSYLELIGIDDRKAALERPVGAAAARVLDQAGGGLATYALLDDDLELTVTALQGADSDIGPVEYGSRRRPDGEPVEWWTAFPPGPLGYDGLPFLIQHAYVGTEWGPAALSERAEFGHPIGSPVHLVQLDVAILEPPSLAAAFFRHLGLEFWAVADLAVATVGAHLIRLVPAREMEVPAVVTLGADVEAPRSVEALGLRFDVKRVELPLPVPHRVWEPPPP